MFNNSWLKRVSLSLKVSPFTASAEGFGFARSNVVHPEMSDSQRVSYEEMMPFGWRIWTRIFPASLNVDGEKSALSCALLKVSLVKEEAEERGFCSCSLSSRPKTSWKSFREALRWRLSSKRFPWKSSQLPSLQWLRRTSSSAWRWRWSLSGPIVRRRSLEWTFLRLKRDLLAWNRLEKKAQQQCTRWNGGWTESGELQELTARPQTLGRRGLVHSEP